MGSEMSCCTAKAKGTDAAANQDRLPSGRQEEEEPVRLKPHLQILCIERNSDCDSTAPSAPRSTVTVSTLAARTLPVLKAPGYSALEVFPKRLDKAKLQGFCNCLSEAGIDTNSWGINGTKMAEHLFWETFVQRGCIITSGCKPACVSSAWLCPVDCPAVALQGDPLTQCIAGANHVMPQANHPHPPQPHPAGLKRVTRIVKIKIVADIFGVDHMLQSRLQFMHDGQCIERKQVLIKRLCWNQESHSAPGKPVPFDPSFSLEHCPNCEHWRSGVKSALKDRLGVVLPFQEQFLEEELLSYSYRVEDDCQSPGFPGLATMYCIHEITLRVINSEAPAMHCLGLPSGQEFATTEGDFNLSLHMAGDEEGLPLGTQLNIWTWVRCSTSPIRSPSRNQTETSLQPISLGEPILKKRVPVPEVSARNMARIQASLKKNNVDKAPSSALVVAQGGRKTDWTIARKMASRIADADYLLREFTNDLQAFPELDLYLLEGENDESHSGSGRTLGDEFQRTVGAFYAIYWLMRLAGDGKDGFSFGVDDEWKPIKHNEDSTAENFHRLFPAEKRLKFYQDSSWENFEQLLVDAEMFYRSDGTLKVNEDRVLTLLVLTAIHDIMKVQPLLPNIQPQHAPYHGYEAGDTISDHDHALSYLMDHYPELLPSFHGLYAKDKLSVAFTQCQLQFNQGWFVQAEAPPGAIFTKFRELLIREHKSNVKPRDIALYFVHWLTDLAGAEPTPLGGCEKFVTKFPLPVLNSFLRSFAFVEQIAHKTETEVMEKYLKMRWEEHVPSLGRPPSGDDAIAKMRLICMAQVNSMKVLAGFDELPPDDKEILSVEMARTGCMCQAYSADLTPADVQGNPMGPALLIYYGPAFLQSLGSDSACRRLTILAEVYRAARALWPLKLAQVGTSVIVRIDTIKSLSTAEILDAMKNGKVWVMVKHNELEAFVEESSTTKLNKFISKGQALHVLDLPM